MATETPEVYSFDRRDRALLKAAMSLVTKVATAKRTRPAELVSVSKLQHILSRLPRVTRGIHAVVHVNGPRRTFGEIETSHWWDVGATDGGLYISSGGF